MKPPMHHEHSDPCFVCFLILVHPSIEATIYRIGFYGEWADEAYSRSCLQLFKSWEACDGKVERPRPWTACIVRRTCWKMLEQSRSNQTRSLEDWMHPQEDPRNDFDVQGFQHALANALTKLPPIYVDVFRLRYYEDLTFKEIGRRLGFHATTASRKYDESLEALGIELAAWREH